MKLRDDESSLRKLVMGNRLAGVSILATMILSYPDIFSRYNEDDVPEVIQKSIHYLEERGM